ncbi:MAG: carbamoyltransferase HypF [Flavobacteriaceae bacterium]|nr:carbamoyltransferase HypF [Flavobacteriaceae bacterium]
MNIIPLQTYQITVFGRVQGVGFRPFIFNLAVNSGLKGFVFNDGKGVVIIIQAKEDEQVEEFTRLINLLKPGSAEIVSLTVTKINSEEIFETFFIKPTPENTSIDLPLTPDFSICPDCEKEMSDPNNRRYFYPFTGCTRCGPRYAITQKFPFERKNTSIGQFEMCPNCLHEYQTPQNIRFHSQTHTCPDCGVKTRLTDADGNILSEDHREIFTLLSEKLKQGEIAAVKNTSGYLLLCDATNAETVRKLRERKKRPTKPFAVMFPTLEKMGEYLRVEDFHVKEFLSPEAPINIIKIRDPKDLAIAEISPGMETIGAMFPYTGMLKLIAYTFTQPLIATSANIHGSPVCSTEKEAVGNLKSIADFFIHHTLEIVHPQDDSIIKFSEKHHQKIILRRARGYAPNMFFVDELEKKNSEGKKILCLGADLKNTFTAVPNNHCYLSEYIGDIAHYDTCLRFEKTIRSYQKIFSFTPEIIVSDKHPLYENSTIIQQLTKENPEIEKYEVQHHEAHFSAILGEHRLWESSEPVLGVIWDGMGFASEKEIWGGEFFLYENKSFRHVAQLEEFSWILGDTMSRTPKISALSISENDEYFKPFFNENEWKIYTRMIEQGTVKTSSMGRLFDAVSFILGFHQPVYFEGEASLYVEKLAVKTYEAEPFELVDYLENENGIQKIPTQKLLKKIREEIRLQPTEIIAMNFHYTLIKSIEKIAKKLQVRSIAFSGGVWQNSVLIDCAIRILKPEYKLYFHEKISPNDENISFGQLNYYLNLNTKTSQ